MAQASRTRAKSRKKAPKRRFRPVRWTLRWLLRGVSVAFLIAVALVVLGSVLNPPTTWYMAQESRRLNGVDHEWVPMDEIAPVMGRAAVAAEDANFCLHWGLDLNAIRTAIDEGGGRGASTISQQVVKNVYLWHGRSWFRKVLEAGMTPVVEAIWSKRRILEVYLNVAEFDEGVFGVEAAARHYFGVGPDALSPVQAARLAAVLPNPKGRSASRPSSFVRKRAASIRDGAATIRADGRAKCFES
ncbi:MAG: monofunctional biosynthetic peptidoglycan transglycosylase [Pseudomonadota bacterium]